MSDFLSSSKSFSVFSKFSTMNIYDLYQYYLRTACWCTEIQLYRNRVVLCWGTKLAEAGPRGSCLAEAGGFQKE